METEEITARINDVKAEQGKGVEDMIFDNLACLVLEEDWEAVAAVLSASGASTVTLGAGVAMVAFGKDAAGSYRRLIKCFRHVGVSHDAGIMGETRMVSITGHLTERSERLSRKVEKTPEQLAEIADKRAIDLAARKASNAANRLQRARDLVAGSKGAKAAK